jgi:hypothetical protein
VAAGTELAALAFACAKKGESEILQVNFGREAAFFI